MSLFNRAKKKIDVILHRPGSTIYKDGRYLVVDMRLSMRSKRGKEIAMETAYAIFDQLEVEGIDFTIAVQSPPKPPDSFSREEAREAVSAAHNVGGDADLPSADQGGFGDESDGRTG